jgi:dynein heavy chain
LTNEIEICRIKLERAKKLISGLSDEQLRWTKDVKKLVEDAALICGNCAVGAGMIAYSGPFTAKYRTRMEKLWENKL